MADRDQERVDPTEEDLQRRLHLREPSLHDSAQPYDGVGAELRAARLRAGVAVETVEARLRIRRAYLDAIEAGRFADLPGSVYAIGFVRSYANLLDLDVEALVGRFKQETSAHTDRTELIFPSPIPEGRLPGARLLVLSVALVGAIYGVWYVVSNKDRVALDQVAEPPARMASESAPPPGAAGPPAADATVSRAVVRRRRRRSCAVTRPLPPGRRSLGAQWWRDLRCPRTPRNRRSRPRRRRPVRCPVRAKSARAMRRRPPIRRPGSAGSRARRRRRQLRLPRIARRAP